MTKSLGETTRADYERISACIDEHVVRFYDDVKWVLFGDIWMNAEDEDDMCTAGCA